MKKIFFLIIAVTSICFAQNELVDSLWNRGDTLTVPIDTVAIFNLKQQIEIPLLRAEKISGDADTLGILTGKIIRHLTTNVPIDTMWSLPVVRDSNYTVVSTLILPTGAYGRSWLIFDPWVDLVKVWITDTAGDATKVSIQGKIEK